MKDRFPCDDVHKPKKEIIIKKTSLPIKHDPMFGNIKQNTVNKKKTK